MLRILRPGRRIDIAEGSPDTQDAIADVERRRHRLREIGETLPPVLLTLTDPVDDGGKVLPAFRRGSHDEKGGGTASGWPRVHVDDLCPEVDELLFHEPSEEAVGLRPLDSLDTQWDQRLKLAGVDGASADGLATPTHRSNAGSSS